MSVAVLCPRGRVYLNKCFEIKIVVVEIVEPGFDAKNGL